MAKHTPSSVRAADEKSDLSLSLEGQVTLQRLGDAVEAWTDLLQEVAKDVTGSASKNAVRYVVTKAKGGSFTLCVRPQVYRLRVLGQWFDGIRIYAAASSPTRSRRTCAGLR